MTLLATYDNICNRIAEASRIDEVIAIRDELDHVKLHARKVRDRAMLAEASVFQVRAEYRLGVLIAQGRAAGLIREGRGRPATACDDQPAPATLAEIGVDRSLSVRAEQTARLDGEALEALLAETRDKIVRGKAIVIDPVREAGKTAELDRRRADHAARTLHGGCVDDLGELALSGFRAKFIGSDPQWKFLTRSAAGEGRSANIHYKTEEVDRIKQLPVGELAADDSMLGMWMVDWCPQDALDLMAHYGFTHVTTLYTWVKTNGQGQPGAALDIWDASTWHMGQGYYTRANPEACWLGVKGNPKRLHFDVRQLIIAPLMEHSRKPDEWLARSERLSEGPYLELQARRPRPGWISWGDELEWTGEAGTWCPEFKPQSSDSYEPKRGA